MVVKILSSSATFKGVSYNTNKVDQNKGELMKVKNFGPLQALDRLGPADFINYLKMVSAQNKRVKSPQFHVAISAKGRSHNKDQLTEIAEKWLSKMGYSQQPYLIIFHKDTDNNHVHIVSTRIDKAGLKISSAFEKRRAIQNLYNIIEIDPKLVAAKDLKNTLLYKFSSIAQFKMILESRGYAINEKNGKFDLFKFGDKVASTTKEEVSERINSNVQKENITDAQSTKNAETLKRLKQLSGIFHKYSTIYDTTLFNKTIPLPGGLKKETNSHNSLFREFFKNEMNIDIIFHSKNGLTPYGYSVVDHKDGNVFKGGEIMPLGEMLNRTVIPSTDLLAVTMTKDASHVLIDREDLPQLIAEELNQHHTEELANDNLKDYDQYGSQDYHQQVSPDIKIDISDDIDDEAILGRNRHRKKQARTNTR